MHVYAVYTRYARSIIQTEARRLVTKCGVPKQDQDDLVSRLTAELVRQLPRFNPERSKLSTFIQRVVEVRSRNILRQYRTKKELARTQTLSLDANASDQDDPEASLHDVTDADQVAILMGKQTYTQHDLSMLRADLHALIQGLPEDLQICCEAIMDGRSLSEVARSMGTSRRSLDRNALERLKNVFRKNGYDDWA